MNKLSRLFLAMVCLFGVLPASAAFKDIKIDLTDGNLLTAEEIADKSMVSFGVAIGDDGSTTRVAADDASAAIVLNGKYHSNEHGWGNFSATVAVEGPVKVSMGTCAWGGDVTIKNAANETVGTFNTNNGTCYHQNKAENIASAIYKGEATTLTISGGSYTPYIAVETVDPSDIKNDIKVTYQLGEVAAEGVVPEAQTVEVGADFTVPANFTLYAEGKTLTGWTDGTNTYAPGQTATAGSEAMTLTAVFTDNTVSLADRTEAVLLNFDFQRQNGAPTVGYQGVTGIWVTQAVVNGQTIDVKLDFDTTSGKIANGNWNDWAQMNGGTKLTVPSYKGATISLEAFSAITTTTIDGQTDYTSGTTISYTVASANETVDIVIGDGSYYRYVKVNLPVIEQPAGGKTFNNEPVTVTWPMTDTANPAAYSVSLDGAISTVAFDYGEASIPGISDITDGNAAKVTTGIKFQPKGGASDVLTWSLKPAKGLTFTPTRLTGYVNRCGTDSEKGITVSAKTGDGSFITLGTWTALRSGKTSTQKPYDATAIYQYDIQLTEEQQAQLAGADFFYLTSSIGVNTGKQGAFGEVTVSGTVNGTAEDVAKYTLTTKSNPEGAGSVNVYPVSAEYEDGSEVQLTATQNFGYHFVNWTDAEGNVVSTESKFKYTMNANAELTANFQAVNTYELAMAVDGGANDYMVTLSPAPTEVDGKNMYEEGTEVTISAASNEILAFTNWSDGQTNSDIKVTMTENVSLTANYSAKDYIVGWDFYLAGNNGRVADFYSNDDNQATALVLTDEAGNTQGWLDKSTVAAGGYESMKGAAVNWKKLGQYYYQTKLNAKDFTDIRVKSQLLCNYNAYSHIVLQYSTDGTEWKDAGDANLAKTKVIYDLDATLPAECDHAESLFIRWKPDLSSSVTGTTAADNDGTAISNIFILAEAAIYDDGKAPELKSTVPAAGATNASATGRIVLTFDKKVQLTDKANGTLNGEKLDLTVSGKTILAQYKGLEYSKEYTFVLAAGSIADLSGNNVLNDNVTLTFSTMTKPVVAKALYDFVVPTDGTFKEALAAAASRSDVSKRFRIFVMQGDYIIPANDKQMVTGSDGKSYPDPKTSFDSPNVSIIGEGMSNTSIANTLPNDLASNPDAGKGGQANPLEGIRTSGVLYLTKNAKNTYFEDITLKSNTADGTGRNVVLVDGGDKTICKDVCLWAYQDTYVSDREQSTYYFEGGLLRGRTDFLCGSGDVFYNGVTLQMCEKGGYIAVPCNNVKYGYVFKDCTIKGETPDVNGNYTLGRPWTEGAEVYYIDTKMEAIPSAIGWSNMADGGCTRMAEYNSTTASGAAIDLSGRATKLGTGTNNPVLTAEEAAEIGNMHNMFGDWDPTIYTEQAAAPANVIIDGNILAWDNDDYALLWAVCKNGKVVAFTTEPVYTVDDTQATWSVRAANEMGGLGDATEAKAGTTGISTVENANGNVVATEYFNLQGIKVGASFKGTVIKVETLDNGTKKTTKLNK